MVYANNARVIEAEELKEIIDEEYTNPTVERLMFIETKAKDNYPAKIFPCFVEAWGEEENANVKTDPGLRFQMVVGQCLDGEFQLVRVVVLAKELGESKRIWDKPPASWLREDTPWAAVEVGIQ